jgi:hypothetical protein
MSDRTAIIVGLAIIIAAVLHGWLGRYQVTATVMGPGAVVFRTDRMTGRVEIVRPQPEPQGVSVASAAMGSAQPLWVCSCPSPLSV